MKLTLVAIEDLKPHPNNAHTHSRSHLRKMGNAFNNFGFLIPPVVDENNVLLTGHGRVAAAKLLGMTEIPTIAADGLSPAKKRAFMLADNKLSEGGGWDRAKLAIELPDLAEILVTEGLDIEATGFSIPEIDQISLDHEENSSDPGDEIDPAMPDDPVSEHGDVWQMGPHRLMCGDARNLEDLGLLMGTERAAMAFLDPPYNVRVQDIGGRGKIKHAEFAMASGEMSGTQYVEFLNDAFCAAISVSCDGAVHFLCIDWRHLGELLEAGKISYPEMLNFVVWVKSNAGMGSFYRSQHELIGVFRVGDKAHLNNIELGRHGRNRSNVWHYAGANTFRAGRMDDLKSHPTVKPIAMVADAIKDCTRRSDVVLDTFSGAGTTLLACERVGRRGFAMEIEPRYVDLAIRRWQAFTRKDAVNVATNVCFDELAKRPVDPALKLAA